MKKSFKQHLLYLSESEREWVYMLDLMVPVKPGYFDFQETETVYRVAGLQSAKNIKKREGKKGIYTGFTKGSTGVSRGIFSGSQYLWVLEGKVQLDSDHDFYTRLDRNGYRWFRSTEFKNMMEVKVKEYFKEKNLEGYSWSYYQNYLTDEKVDKKEQGERKRDFIKWYYDTSKKIIKYYGKDIVKEIKDKYKDPTAGYANDEILFNEYKIIGAYIISNYSEKEIYTEGMDYWVFTMEGDPFSQQIQELKKNKIPQLGFIFKEDISNIDKDLGRTPEKYKFDIDIKKLNKEIRNGLETYEKNQRSMRV
jgi:hypothetical protein